MVWKPDYTLVANAKAFLRIDDTVDDVQLAMYIRSASRAIDKFCGRQFGQVAAAQVREFEGKWDHRIAKSVYEIDDLGDITGLSILSAAGTTITGYELWPLNAVDTGDVYTQLRVAGGWSASLGEKLTIEAKWGWAEIPAEVVNATLMQVARLAARRDSPYGVAGSPSEGSEIRLLSKLDPDVMVVLDPLKRKWWAA